MPSPVFLSDGGAGTALTPTTAAVTVFDIVGSGSVVSQTTVKEHGYGALKHDSAASASAYVVRTCLADAGRRIAVRVRFDAAPASNTGVIRLLTAANATVAEIRLVSTGKLALYAGATGSTLQQTGATTLSMNGTTWYHIAFCYTITSASVSEFRVYLNGTLELTASNPATQVTASARLRIGWTGTSPGASKLMYSQDVYVDDGTDLAYPGDIRVTTKWPNATGASNAFDTANGTGTNRWDRVKERPASSTNGYTQAGTSQVSEQYDVEGAASGDDDLTGATIVGWGGWVYYAVAAAAGSVLAAMWVNGTANTLTTILGSGVYGADYKPATVTTYPSGTQTIGLRSSGSAVDVSLGECGVFVAYTPGGAAAVGPPVFRRRVQHWTRR